MAEFNFLGSWNDSVEILGTIIQSDNFTFLLDEVYLEAIPVWFRSPTEEMLKYLKDHRGSVILWSRQFSFFPPVFRMYEGGIRDIDLSFSGPALHLALAIEGRKGKELRCQLGHGWVGYPSTFYHPETCEPYKPPEALIQAFSDVNKIIRSLCERRYVLSRRVTGKGEVKPAIETLWIGKKGLSLVEMGEAVIILGHGNQFTASDLSKNRTDLLAYLEEFTND